MKPYQVNMYGVEIVPSLKFAFLKVEFRACDN